MTAFDAQAARERAERVASAYVRLTLGSFVLPSPDDEKRQLARDVLALDAQVTALREALADVREWITEDGNPIEDYWICCLVNRIDRALAAVPPPEEGAER